MKHAIATALLAGLGMLTAATAFTASAPQAHAKTITGDCSLTVDGKVYVDIKKTCRIEFMGGDGSFTINAGTAKPGYFAYVTMLEKGLASVSWNETPKSMSAQAPLGEDFRRKGGCWIGKRAKVCAFKS